MSHILVVDDEKYVRESLSLALMNAGHTIDAAQDGLEALRFLASRQYDLILTDMMMPNMNGLEFLQQVRRQGGSKIPVIVISGRATDESASEVLQTGACDLLVKPFELKRLIQTIHQMLSTHAQTAKPKDSRTAEAADPSGPGATQVPSLAMVWQQIQESWKHLLLFPDEEKNVKTIMQMIRDTTSADRMLLLISRPPQPDRAWMQTDAEPEPADQGWEQEKAWIQSLAGQESRQLLFDLRQDMPGQAILGYLEGSAVVLPMRAGQEMRGGLLLVRPTPQGFNPEWIPILELLTGIFGLILENAHLAEDKTNGYMDTIQSLFATLEAKNQKVYNHSARVACYALLLAKKLGFNDTELRNLEFLALLHDIGKIAVPDAILDKPEGLSREEKEILQNHSQAGENILRPLRFIPDADRAIRHHHERFDGQGYPDRLRGEDIPLFARIIAIADAFDLTLSAAGDDQQSQLSAIQKMIEGEGKQFDPVLLKQFLSAYGKILMINKNQNA